MGHFYFGGPAQKWVRSKPALTGWPCAKEEALTRSIFGIDDEGIG